ncbi:hypothetical protein [Streptomyces sp. NPDC005732]|uniref:hypothetical protein n=1 Tax=Streptomyces sp. NPDC005732 TaxID=3157057 RepID=UPI0033E13597
MPRSVFLGRVVGGDEPLWLPEDRYWALALLEVEADRCPDCGQPWCEATSPDNEDAYRAALVKCHACAISAKTVRAHQDKRGDTDGLHVNINRH